MVTLSETGSVGKVTVQRNELLITGRYFVLQSAPYMCLVWRTHAVTLDIMLSLYLSTRGSTRPLIPIAERAVTAACEVGISSF